MIDILLATYNGEKYIDKQLKSLLTQSDVEGGEGIRLLIRDDGSTDDTVEIIKKRLEYYKEKRSDTIDVKLISGKHPTGSPAGNFMKLLEVSDGDYIMFSDQDDMWYRRKTEVTYAAMKKCEAKYDKDTPILVHSDMAVMDDEGRKVAQSFYKYQMLPEDDSLNQLLIQNTVTGCTVMINRSAAELLRRAPVSEMVLMHDHYLAILVAACGHIEYIAEPLMRYRRHSANVVGPKAAGSLQEYTSRAKSGRTKFLHDMDLSYRQAGYIYKRYESEIMSRGGRKKCELLKEYSELIMADKMEKMKFFQKYDVYKNGTLKKIVQMVWC